MQSEKFMAVTGKVPRNVRTASKQTWRRKERGWGKAARRVVGDKKSILSSFFFPFQIPQWTVPVGRPIDHRPINYRLLPRNVVCSGTGFYHFCPGRQAQINPACAALPIPAAAGGVDDAAATQKLNSAKSDQLSPD